MIIIEFSFVIIVTLGYIGATIGNLSCQAPNPAINPDSFFVCQKLIPVSDILQTAFHENFLVAWGTANFRPKQQQLVSSSPPYPMLFT